MGRNFINRFIAVMAAILIVCPLVKSYNSDDLVSIAESFAAVSDSGRSAGEQTGSAVVTKPAAAAPKVIVTTTAADSPQKVIVTTTVAAKSAPKTTAVAAAYSAIQTYPVAEVSLYYKGTEHYEKELSCTSGDTVEIYCSGSFTGDFKVSASSEYLHCEYDFYPNSSYYSGTIKVSVDPETPSGKYTVKAEAESPYFNYQASDSITIYVDNPIITTTAAKTTTTTTTTTTTIVTYQVAQVSLYYKGTGHYEKELSCTSGDTVEIYCSGSFTGDFKVSASSEYLHCEYDFYPSSSYYSGTIKVSVAPETPSGKYTVTAEAESPYFNYQASDSITIYVDNPIITTTAAKTTTTKKTTTTTISRENTTTTSTMTSTTSTTYTTTVTVPMPEVRFMVYDNVWDAIPGDTIEIYCETQYATSFYVESSSKYLHIENVGSPYYYGDRVPIKISIAPDTPSGEYKITAKAENGYSFDYFSAYDSVIIKVQKPAPVEVLYDVNCDGKVGIADAVTLQKYLLGTGELKQWQNADANQDNQIDSFDLCLLKQKLLKNNLV